MIISKKELESIRGGAWSAAMVSALVKCSTGIFKLGQYLGTYVRSIIWKKYC